MSAAPQRSAARSTARGEVRQDLPAQELALTVIGTVFARSLFAALDGRESKPPHEPPARWNSLVRLLGFPPPSEPLSKEGVRP